VQQWSRQPDHDHRFAQLDVHNPLTQAARPSGAQCDAALTDLSKRLSQY
jgi:hypothetical protein